MNRIIKSLQIIFILVMSISCSEDSDETLEPIYRIPVVVHVVHNGEPVGEGANISFEQIRSQIDVLNEDFRRMSGTNGNIGVLESVDTKIEFYLAESKPDGSLLREPGVDRIDGGLQEWPKGPFRNPIDMILKPQTIWNPDEYFNIWTVNFGGFISRDLLGYAQFPDEDGIPGLEDASDNESTDGIVIGYKYFGSSEKGNFPALTEPFNLGRTTTHETGHWLGLRHIWGDGDCDVDDYCEDTPNASSPSYGCSHGKITCGSLDMIENYMDYSDDICMGAFTQDQKERMRYVLNNSPRRKDLVEIINE